ncbi:MAG: P22 phage major capsid protein family protein [Candidatus Omnitrophica bacterium]|nr:P22 phage major capsid protein family protein [Candidatus Omnitrophota bacterium]
MANTVLTMGLIAKRAVKVLENNLVMANQVYRGYEDEYQKNVNGYKPGDTITVRRPAEYGVRKGPVIKIQDSVEGSLQIKVDRQIGVDLNFSSKDLTLDIVDFSERFLDSALISIAQQVDQDVASLYADIPNWVGTPGAVLTNFDSFAAATQRFDDTSISPEPRVGIVSPRDARGLQANLTGPQSVFAPSMVDDVYRTGMLPPVDGVKLFKTQNTPIISTGTRTPTGGTLNGGQLQTTWLATKDTNTMQLTFTNIGANATVKKGEVFTLGGVFDVNIRSKIALPYLKNFVVMADGTADGAGNVVLTISPPIIPAGATPLESAYQNVSAVPASNAPVTFFGAASTSYNNNIVFNKNAFALVMVPLEKPQGGLAQCSRQSYKGVSVRLASFWDGINDNNIWRMDVLYGVKTVDPRQAVRLSGT